MSDSLTNNKLRSIIGEIPNWIFEYLELSDEIKKEWKFGSKASDFGGHSQFVQLFSRRIEAIISDTVAKAEREAKLNLAKGLTIGGRHGVDIFYQGIPIERFIDKLKSQQESEES